MEYFVLRLYVKDLKLMIPVKNVEELGLRLIIDGDFVDEVLKVLNSEQSDMSDTWNKRYRNNMEKLKTGDVLDIAVVVRDLKFATDKRVYLLARKCFGCQNDFSK